MLKLGRFRLRNGNVPLRHRLCDCRVLANLERVVSTEVFDKTLVVGDVLDIAGNHLNAEFRNVRCRFLGDLVGESIPVNVQF